MVMATMSCFRLFTHFVFCAISFALLSAGNKRDARMAITAMTTSNSISVKPLPICLRRETIRKVRTDQKLKPVRCRVKRLTVERSNSFWSAETCFRFRQATCRRRIYTNCEDFVMGSPIVRPGYRYNENCWGERANPQLGTCSPLVRIREGAGLQYR